MIMMYSLIIILSSIILAALYFGDAKFSTVKKEKNPAIDTHKHRFANGDEIDEDEYEERKAVLAEDFTYKP